MQAQAVSQAELQAVQAELQGATEMLDSMQQMASSSMQGQEEAQKQMDALTSQLQAAIQVLVSPHYDPLCDCYKLPRNGAIQAVIASYQQWYLERVESTLPKLLLPATGNNKHRHFAAGAVSLSTCSVCAVKMMTATGIKLEGIIVTLSEYAQAGVST